MVFRASAQRGVIMRDPFDVWDEIEDKIEKNEERAERIRDTIDNVSCFLPDPGTMGLFALDLATDILDNIFD